MGANGREGEFTVGTPNGARIFTEVKSPSWEGELSPEERTNGRKDQGKILDGEARMIALWERVQFEVGKAYKKFRDDMSNLLIIADDLFVSLEHGTETQADIALYATKTGCFLQQCTAESWRSWFVLGQEQSCRSVV